ncbi:MAG: STAS domain-containing protein [Ruminococcus sp.]|nr:STAS domain-containing protein [Ruminococcus sp.]
MNTRRMNGDTLEILCGEEVALSLSEKMIENEMHIEISGEIRNEVAHEFEDELMAAFSVCKVVKVNMSKITYIASVAMRALLSVQQMIDEDDEATMIITHISPEVKQIFEVSGFIDILNIEE